jgi:hypothetical protein
MRSYELLTAQGGGTQEEGEETEDLTPSPVPGELPDTMPPEPGTLPEEPDVDVPEPESPPVPESVDGGLARIG